MQPQDPQLQQDASVFANFMALLVVPVVVDNSPQRAAAHLAEAEDCEELEAGGHLQVLRVGGKLGRLHIPPQLLPVVIAPVLEVACMQMFVVEGQPAAARHDGPLADGGTHCHHDVQEGHPEDDHVQEALPRVALLHLVHDATDHLVAGDAEGGEARERAREGEPPEEAGDDQGPVVDVGLAKLPVAQRDVRHALVQILAVRVPAEHPIVDVFELENVPEGPEEERKQ
mmetsp:Transcript_117983/g.328787  ORF Transcript_117983/g.328787 Transcript_117983/m.328787 type:complete len:228 (-) Transcript_117983:260-943(-)